MNDNELFDIFSAGYKAGLLQALKDVEANFKAAQIHGDDFYGKSLPSYEEINMACNVAFDKWQIIELNRKANNGTL